MLTGRYPCYRIYACADGYLSVGALEPKFWREFVEVIGLPELAGSGLVDGEEGQRTVAAVQAVLRTRTRAQWARDARRTRRVRRAGAGRRGDLRASPGAQPRHATRRR